MFDALRELSDAWTVIWSVPIKRFEPKARHLNEIDFLLLNEELGIVVLEVKGGSIRVDEQGWWTQPTGSHNWHKLARSPFVQAADERFALGRYLAGRLNETLAKNTVAHAVAFPDLIITGEMGPDAPRTLVLDATDLRAPEIALNRVRHEWGAISRVSAAVLKSIQSLVVPKMELTVLSSTAVEETNRKLERETRRQAQMVEDQAAAYRAILSTERVVIIGGAGTGKTVIAAKVAREYADAGCRVLMLCHRAGVQSFLETILEIPKTSSDTLSRNGDEFVDVAGWMKLSRAIASATARSNIRPADPMLPDYVLELREQLDQPYDALVIDEGQEFTELQLDALKWLLADPDVSPVYIFADPFQHSGLFSTPLRDRVKPVLEYRWVPPKGWQLLALHTNCRNSTQISEIAARFYPGDPPESWVEGPPAVFHQVARNKILPGAIEQVRRIQSDEGFRANQLLLILIGFTFEDAQVAARSQHIALVDVGHLYRFPLTGLELRVATGSPDQVQGLEADAVIVAFAKDRDLASARELYISASRARGSLDVFSRLSRDDFFSLADELQRPVSSGRE